MNSVREYFKPIEKNWGYHFLVASTTNKIEKPEWYLNQTLNLISEHIDQVEEKVNLNPNESKQVEVKHLFLFCMLELVRKRLNTDMKTIVDQIDEDKRYEVILIHTYNEVISFVKIVRLLLGEKYSKLDEQYDLMAEFSHQRLFERITDIEWDYAKKNLDEMKESKAKWDPVLEGDYVDPYKIPRCVDRFLIQIKSISERVECFRQDDCRFQLIDLQCSLFERFLEFMKQSTESATVGKNLLSDFLFLSEESTIDLSKILRVLNGINFLRLILKEKCFISSDIVDNLETDLTKRLTRITQDYKQFFNRLIMKVIDIHEVADCDLPDFFSFVQPKVADDIYVTIRDETTKLHETRQTQHMFKTLSFG